MTLLEVHPLEGAGAEILGADISSMNAGEWSQIEAAFASFGLLVFRDQIITEGEHVTFAARWGRAVQPKSNIHGVFPEIAVSPTNATPSNERGVWHADQSFLSVPTLGAVEVVRGQPADGAHTRFASTYAAFDALTTGTQKALEALTAVHALNTEGSSNHGIGDCSWCDPLAQGSEGASAKHPIVILHPISGRKALFVNPTFTTSVVDMEEAAGLALLNQLYEHCQRPEFIANVEWEPGTVVMWDNRAMLHFTEPSELTPLTHRVTLGGTTLRPAITPDKVDPSLTQRAGATLAGGILTAAMTGIAEVIHPERVKQDIEIVSEAPEPDDLPELDFGELPPLD